MYCRNGLLCDDAFILKRLSGEFVTDTAMAGTSMLIYQKAGFSEEIRKSSVRSFISPVIEPSTLVS
jgi:sugar (pentulose or hexulose) kinase